MSGMNVEMSGPGESDEAEFDAIMDPKVQESIGRSLKAHYDDLINAPVPDKFLVLLAQLEAKESRSAAGDASDERP
ncbi:NepR family anti-sigma factor [Bosea sp. (in: a-proteobacteria)]|uniref:NepR family anti-sigma factor n=1 Tax=Bosea sp. (in: a-proteobacteria) TaxID=1871050 RepID=UPI003F70C642